MHPISSLPTGTTGYGQLSISSSAGPAIDRKNATGVWALVGTPDEVKAFQAAGPAQTAAIVASANADQALYAASKTGRSITGLSVSATGVYGTSTSGRGIEGWSTTNYGVSGDSHTFAGVRGTSVSAAGTEGWSTTNAGVFGTSQSGDGVYGVSNGAGAGIHGVNTKGGNAALFEGIVQVNGNMNVTGDIVFAGGHDCAEHFDLAPGMQAEAGSVVVILDGGVVAPCSEAYDKRAAGVISGAGAYHFDLAPGMQAEAGSVVVILDGGVVAPCSEAYDKRAAGVISGAGAYRPAIVLGDASTDGSRPPVALIGRVCCKVDADFAPIEPGDLLTTSPTTGHAMKALDSGRAFGAVIGKAIGRLDAGRGMVPMLVCLQ